MEHMDQDMTEQSLRVGLGEIGRGIDPVEADDGAALVSPRQEQVSPEPASAIRLEPLEQAQDAMPRGGAP